MYWRFEHFRCIVYLSIYIVFITCCIPICMGGFKNSSILKLYCCVFVFLHVFVLICYFFFYAMFPILWQLFVFFLYLLFVILLICVSFNCWCCACLFGIVCNVLLFLLSVLSYQFPLFSLNRDEIPHEWFWCLLLIWAPSDVFFVSIGWLEPLLQLEAPFYFVNFGDNMVG